MKKVLVFFVVFLMVACGGGKETVKKEALEKKAEKVTVEKKKTETAQVAGEKQKTKEVKSTQKKTVTETGQVGEVSKGVQKSDEKKVEEIPVEKKEAGLSQRTEKEVLQKVATQEAVVKKEEKVVSVQRKESEEQRDLEKLLRLQNFLIEDIYFDPGEYQVPSLTFNSNYIVTLVKIVKALRNDRDIRVRLYGHSDASGDEETNVLLSQERCKTVANLIVGMFGPDEKEDIARRIEIIPVGSKELLISSPDKSKSFINRRVSIELTYDKERKGQLFSEIVKKTEVKKKKIYEYKPKAVKSSIEELYNNGRQLFNQKRYREAIAVFEVMISANPGHNLADNAQWWIGEAYYFQGKYKDALSAYKKVFDYGDGNKSAYAQLRIGYCYLKLGNRERAIKEFEKVITNYPAAKEEAEKARTILKNIRGY